MAQLCAFFSKFRVVLLTRGLFDVLDDLLARTLCSLFHRPLLGGDDEPETLSYQIVLFGPIGADFRQCIVRSDAVILPEPNIDGDGQLVH